MKVEIISLSEFVPLDMKVIRII